MKAVLLALTILLVLTVISAQSMYGYGPPPMYGYGPPPMYLIGGYPGYPGRQIGVVWGGAGPGPRYSHGFRN